MAKKRLWLLLPVALLLYVGLELWLGCPIRGLTGVPCPGCGMTRAVLACLRGEPAAAFRLHPLFFLPLPMLLAAGGYLLYKKRAVRRACAAVLALCGAALLAVYLLRLQAGAIL